MAEWYSDSNLRTPRSMREAGMGEDKIHDQAAQERHWGLFVMGFAVGVTATLLMLLGGVL
jgi:hypothetical protein